MYQLINVGGAAGGDAFLLLGAEKTALMDSGYSFAAPKMIENIKAVLGDRPLDYVLLTHSHFDHACGSAMCQAVWPDVKVVSSEYAANVFTKPSAAKTMLEMNRSAAEMCGVELDPSVPTQLRTDIIVHEGDVIDLGGITFVVYEVPGHTRGSICFYSPEEKLMIGSETFGVPSEGVATVMPCCVVGYNMTMEAIKKASAIDVEHYLMPHYGEIHGDAVKKFFKDALYWTEYVKDMIVSGHLAGKTDEELVQQYKEMFYTKCQAIKQSEAAFLINVRHKIPMIIREQVI